MGRLSGDGGWVAQPEEVLRAIAARQNGALTAQQARLAGVSRQQLRTLLAHGWSSPVRGVLVEPRPSDPFLAGLRAALLGCPEAAACWLTAARVHKLAGLPRWTPRELPHLLLPGDIARPQRRGVHLHSGLREQDRVLLACCFVTTLARTVADLSLRLRGDDLVCLLDSALRAGWTITDHSLSRRQRARLQAALILADGRAESPLETVLRLLLVRAGLAPETLQLQLFDRNGWCFARLDMAWPSRRLAVEADGREHHDKPEALYRDRRRQNDIELAGWTVLRFTWNDVVHHPNWVVAQVRRALAGETPKS
jgi:hypothetical protein